MAAGATYEPIATQTLAVAATSITFSSIAASWTDLRLVLTFTHSIGSGQAQLRFNDDAGSNYSWTNISGNGSSASSTRETSQTYMYISADSSTTIPSFIAFDVFNYAGSTYKTSLNSISEDKNGSGIMRNSVGLWRSTSAINKIVIGNFDNIRLYSIGTTATLYGIKAA